MKKKSAKPFKPAHAAIISPLDLVALHRALSDRGTPRARKSARKLLAQRSSADADEATRDRYHHYQCEADHQYSKDGEIEVDCDAVVSEGEDGAYVSAWVFVQKPESEE